MQYLASLTSYVTNRALKTIAILYKLFWGKNEIWATTLHQHLEQAVASGDPYQVCLS